MERHICYRCGRIWGAIESGQIDRGMTTLNSPGFECGMCWDDGFQAKSVDNGGGFWVTECSHFTHVPYKDYMKSEAWKEKRQDRMKKDGYKCVMCGTAKNLCVHHITYENIGDEPLDDLITVCGKCHEKLHETDLRNK